MAKRKKDDSLIMIRTLRQCFPDGGGAVLAADQVYSLSASVVARLPAGSYYRIGAKRASSPDDKMVRTANTSEAVGGRQ